MHVFYVILTATTISWQRQFLRWRKTGAPDEKLPTCGKTKVVRYMEAVSRRRSVGRGVFRWNPGSLLGYGVVHRKKIPTMLLNLNLYKWTSRRTVAISMFRIRQKHILSLTRKLLFFLAFSTWLCYCTWQWQGSTICSTRQGFNKTWCMMTKTEVDTEHFLLYLSGLLPLGRAVLLPLCRQSLIVTDFNKMLSKHSNYEYHGWLS